MSQIDQINTKSYFHSHIQQQTLIKPKETAELKSANGSRAAQRKFLAEATQAVPPTVAPDSKIIDDLKNLNLGVTGALDQLMKDIGGVKNLSSYRTRDGLWSLLDLCGRTFDPKTVTLTNAITTLLQNHIQFSLAPRYQWDQKNGYCGETSFITEGLANGEYMSQYWARFYATGSQKKQLLLGDGVHPNSADNLLAQAMHLDVEEWKTQSGNTSDFIAWAQKQLHAGYSVIAGLYTNENTFYGDTDPDAGDSEYDHIVVITAIRDGKIYFCDNGLYGNGPNRAPSNDSPYEFCYSISQFMGTREQANTPFENPNPSIPRSIYTLPDEDKNNYGVAVKGLKSSSELLPIHLLTSINNEPKPPASTKVTLTGCITGLTPGKKYNIYVYNKFGEKAIPDSDFNKNSHMAAQCISFTASGTSYVFTNQIKSTDQIAYRVVPADGP